MHKCDEHERLWRKVDSISLRVWLILILLAGIFGADTVFRVVSAPGESRQWERVKYTSATASTTFPVRK